MFLLRTLYVREPTAAGRTTCARYFEAAPRDGTVRDCRRNGRDPDAAAPIGWWEKFGHLPPAAAEDHPRDGLLNAAASRTARSWQTFTVSHCGQTVVQFRTPIRTRIPRAPVRCFPFLFLGRAFRREYATVWFGS